MTMSVSDKLPRRSGGSRINVKKCELIALQGSIDSLIRYSFSINLISHCSEEIVFRSRRSDG